MAVGAGAGEAEVSGGVVIAVGAVVGLAVGILVSVTTDLPLAPEVGLALGALRRLAPEPRADAEVSEQAVQGLVLIVIPILFNIDHAVRQRFDYPDVLRRPTHEVLERFRAGGAALILIWWAFALSAVLFTALAVLLAIAVADADRSVVILGAVVGVLRRSSSFSA